VNLAGAWFLGWLFSSLPTGRLGFYRRGGAGPSAATPLAIRPQQVEESATVYAVFAIE
jgi:hypothetical protein